MLICLVCLTGEVTWFKVYELSLLSTDSWLLWLQHVVLLLTGCKQMCVCMEYVVVCVSEGASHADGIVP